MPDLELSNEAAPALPPVPPRDPYASKPKQQFTRKTRKRRAQLGEITTFQGKPVVAWIENQKIHFHICRDKGADPSPVSLRDLFFKHTGFLEQQPLPI